jgi:hypothetical protein
MITRPDITVGLPERTDLAADLAEGARGDPHVLKGMLVQLTLRQCPLTTWVFVAKTTDKFLLGLDVFHTDDDSMDFRCHVL